MTTSILRERIANLRLRPDAPWPSQIAARRGYRHRALRAVARKSARKRLESRENTG